MVLDIVAVVIGVLYTIRKLDVRRREPEQYPHVPRAEFLRWRGQEAFAYSLISTASFAKLLLDYGFVYYARRAQLDLQIVRVVGASLFVGWLVALIVGAVLANRARKLRERLQVNLSMPPKNE